MWRLLEARVRPQLVRWIFLVVASALTTAILSYWNPGIRASPEHAATALGLLVLTIYWPLRLASLAAERRQARLRLLAQLPVTPRQLAWVRAIEPIVPPLLTALLVALVAGVGRLWIGGTFHDSGPLRLLGLIFALLLAVDQLYLLWDDLWVRWFDDGDRGWMGLAGLLGAALALGGLLAFLDLGFRQLVSDFVHWLDYGKIFGALIALALLAGLSGQALFARRTDWTTL